MKTAGGVAPDDDRSEPPRREADIIIIVPGAVVMARLRGAGPAVEAIQQRAGVSSKAPAIVGGLDMTEASFDHCVVLLAAEERKKTPAAS